MMSARIRRHLTVIREKHGDLESACNRCGACCHAQVAVNGVRVVVKALYCKYLEHDAEGRSRCTVYAERREKAPWCLDAPAGLTLQAFPDECPYVDGLTAYKGPEVLNEFQHRLIEPIVREALSGEPCPPWAEVEAWNRFLERKK